MREQDTTMDASDRETTGSSIDDPIAGYRVTRSFRFYGTEFLPGDAITERVTRHNRFEALLRTGYIKRI